MFKKKGSILKLPKHIVPSHKKYAHRIVCEVDMEVLLNKDIRVTQDAVSGAEVKTIIDAPGRVLLLAKSSGIAMVRIKSGKPKITTSFYNITADANWQTQYIYGFDL